MEIENVSFNAKVNTGRDRYMCRKVKFSEVYATMLANESVMKDLPFLIVASGSQQEGEKEYYTSKVILKNYFSDWELSWKNDVIHSFCPIDVQTAVEAEGYERHKLILRAGNNVYIAELETDEHDQLVLAPRKASARGRARHVM